MPKEDEAIKFVLRWGASYSKKMLRSPTYVELISSGQLNLITDEKLRNALAIFDQRALDTSFNFRSIHNVATVNYNYLPKYSTLQPVNPDIPDIREVESYDFAAILSDENYLSGLKINCNYSA
ncbi:hypothetical protein MNBD_GAMMA03-1268 [hydrothermal vent metagenome]|uniref:Uncharacterized protein n=1 Tax=hydrothermal vent metagenome TaxID=652676 RepID=A0A3B0VXB9_9ZZZZ